MRLVIGFIFFTLALFASGTPIKSDFKACFNKSTPSFIKIRGKNGIAVSKHTVLLFSKRYLRGYLKRDPFLGLYLFKVKKALKPVKFVKFSKVKKTVAVIGKKDFDIAKIVMYSNGLDNPAKIDKFTKANKLIECVCCRAFGISRGKNSFIDSDFILRFLKHRYVIYADAGIKLTQKRGHIFVKEINPFFKHLRLKKGDEIVLLNGISFQNVSSLSKYILFSKPGRVIDVSYKRGKHIYKQKIKLQKKIAGGLIGQTYLESIGIVLGYDLKIRYIKKNSLAFRLGLKKGDKLLKVNDNYIHRYSDVRKVVSGVKKREMYLLVSRNDFQFFVHFRR